MAETILSPGVLQRENDQSFIAPVPTEEGAAIVGPTVKGPVNIPTIVTSYSDFTTVFGSYIESGSRSYSFLTSIAANNYFQNGGNSLLVTRVVSQSFLPATSSNAGAAAGNAGLYSINDFQISESFSFPAGAINDGGLSDLANGTYEFIATASDAGTLSVNGSGAVLHFVVAGNAVTVASASDGGRGYRSGDTIAVSSSFFGSTGPTAGNVTITLGSTILDGIGGTGTNENNTDGKSPFVLETISEGEIMNSGHVQVANGALATGSVDNLRWSVESVNTSSGAFSLVVRQGNDNNSQKLVLESFNNLNLDPNSQNYIERVIGNMNQTLSNDGTDFFIKDVGEFRNVSKYIRVKRVNNLTPDYFDNNGNPKPEFTGSLPIVGSGSFNGAVGSNIPDAGADRQMRFYDNINNDDSQGLVGANYNNVLKLLANQDDYRYNVITVPGLIAANSNQSAAITTMVNNSISRGDNISVIDLVNYNTGIATVLSQAGGFDSSYAATYWPWVQTVDPNTGELVWVPGSTMIPGVYAFTDASSDPWFAPAGITRGGLGQVVRAERKLTVSNRDELYEANVNPIATFPGQGVVVFGQKTLQKKASALDRVNVRRLLIALKSFIGQVSDNLVFEQNTIVTRNNFLSQVNPYLESVQQRQGLYAFKVVMDASNNTPSVIDRNELVGQIYLQPTKTAEFIILDFNVLPTGATFPA